MHMLPFIPYSLDGSVVTLLGSLPGPINTDNSVAPLVVAVHQIDDQLLTNEFCTEEVSSLLGSLYCIEGGKVLDPTSIREIQVAEGLKTQNNALIPCHQLGKRHMIVTHKACYWERQP